MLTSILVRAKAPQTGLEWVRRFERTRVRLNVDVEVGSPDVERLLEQQSAEGAMLIVEDGYVILLRKRADSFGGA